MTAWGVIALSWATLLVLWAVWDELCDTRGDRRHCEPPVTIVGEQDPWDEYVLALKPGDVIVGEDGVEYEVTEQWSADAIVQTLADLDQLPEIAA